MKTNSCALIGIASAAAIFFAACTPDQQPTVKSSPPAGAEGVGGQGASAKIADEVENLLNKKLEGNKKTTDKRLEDLESSLKITQSQNKELLIKLERAEGALEAAKTLLHSQDKRTDKLAEEIVSQRVSQTNLAETVSRELDKHRVVISNLVFETFASSSKNPTFSEVTLDPSDPSGFLRVNTSSGFFLVMLKNVEPYLDGHRVSIEIGNPLSATYKNLKLKATWGKKLDLEAVKSDPDAYAKWQANLKNKDVTIPDDVRPAAWNKVSFILSPSKADEMGYLKLKLDFDTVSLRKSDAP